MDRIVLLCHVISADGIYRDLQKLEAVLIWERYTSVTEVQSFLGLTGYYRHLVENFSRIAAVFHYVIRKGVGFIWDDKCGRSFQRLKLRLTSCVGTNSS